MKKKCYTSPAMRIVLAGPCTPIASSTFGVHNTEANSEVGAGSKLSSVDFLD